MSGGTLRALVVGTGDMARRHLHGYSLPDSVETAAVVGRSPERARALAAEYGVPTTYATVGEALAAERVDVASVCLPTKLHPPLAIELLQAGVHVLTEKPIALDLEDARRMTDAARRADRTLSVVFNRRFSSGFDEVRSRLSALGSPLVYRTDDLRKIRPKRAMHDVEQNGGPFIDCACHDFDLLLELFGPAESVYATGHTFATSERTGFPSQRIPVDTGSVVLRFQSGATAEIFYSWGLPDHDAYWIRRVFLGPGGVIAAIGDFGETVEYYRGDGVKQTTEHFVPDGHDRQIAAFVEAVRAGAGNAAAGEAGGRPPTSAGVVPPEAGMRALVLSLAALESMETGEVIKVRKRLEEASI